LDLLGGATGRLNGLAKATGKELDEQNRHLERIMGKVSFLKYHHHHHMCAGMILTVYRAISSTTKSP
jgi:hypothetical protein